MSIILHHKEEDAEELEKGADYDENMENRVDVAFARFLADGVNDGADGVGDTAEYK